MDNDLISRAKHLLNCRVSELNENQCNIIIQVSDETAQKLIETFCAIFDKRDDYWTVNKNSGKMR